MKNNHLNREEKKRILKEFYQTKNGRILKVRFNRLLLTGILLIIYGSYLIIDACLNHYSLLGITSGIILYVFALVFLVGRNKLLSKNIHNYIKNKGKEN